MWPFKRKSQPRPQYIVTASGFRYRLLTDVPIEAGYQKVAAQLLPGERLYRMMDGPHRMAGKLVPVLMKDQANFDESVDRMKQGSWHFSLAAGVPVHSDLIVEEAVIAPAGLMRMRGFRHGNREQ
jgi:hypothetical protein